MKEKIEKLEKALQNPKITPEIKATLEKALAKIRAESGGYKQPEVFKPTKEETEAAVKEVAKHLGKDKVLTSTDHPDIKVRGKKEKAEKQAPAVKKVADQEREQQYKAAVADLIKTIESGKSLSIAEVVKYGKEIQALRSKHSQGDTKADNKNRLTPTKENLLRWINNPGGFDLIGVDTSSKNDATADLKQVRKETVFHLIGKIKAN